MRHGIRMGLILALSVDVDPDSEWLEDLCKPIHLSDLPPLSRERKTSNDNPFYCL